MTKEEREKVYQETLKRLKEYDESCGKRVLGIDEAGRGPLLGPVVVAGVIMKKDSNILGVRDSKKLTDKKRKELYDKILKDVKYYDIQIIDSNTIDEINILEATKKGTEKIIYNLKDNADIVLLDALNKINTYGLESKSIVKGDDTSYSIACASIIAKVTRDNMMDIYDEMYPEYGIKSHKGYGTKKHYEAIKEYGVLDIHRKSFLKNLNKH